MRIIQMNPDCSNSIGKAGENLAVQARFPVVDTFRALYGEGTFVLCLLRAKDAEPYAVPTGIDGADVVWTITAADTQFPGYAEAELRYYAGDVLAKSVRYRLFVEPSVGDPSAQPPEPMQDWIGEWMDSKEKIDGFLQAMEGGLDGQVWTKTGDHAQWSSQQSAGITEKTWQLIKSAVVPSDPSSDTSGVTWVTNENGIYRFVIDSNNDGNPFSYKKIRLIVKIPNKDAGGCCTGNFRPLLGINIPAPTGNEGWVFLPYNGNQNWASVIVEIRVEDDGFVKTELDGSTNAVFSPMPGYYLDYASKHFENRSLPSKFESNPPSAINNVVFDCGTVVYKSGTIIELYAEV